MDFIKDSDCTIDTPVVLGRPKKAVYGAGVRLLPKVPGKHETPYERSVFLPNLLPLEDYDIIIILFSGGKDSAAAYYRLREMGVPKHRIELWHHSIDGNHPTRRMDWPVTPTYVRAFADVEGVKLRVSARVNGFWGEVYRVGASYPVIYEDEGEMKTCKLTPQQKESDRLRSLILEDMSNIDDLKQYGYRMKFPAKSADLSRRWCSACLKIDIASAVIRNLDMLKASVEGSVTTHVKCRTENVNILVVSGERRGESAGRAAYNEMELHRTNATKKAKRLVHHWRAVIDYSERDVWEILRRHSVTPHPCYTCGWNRCSCMLCIFSLPRHWAGIRELFPADFEEICRDEERLGFTLDNNTNLREYVGDAESCVWKGDPKALWQLTTGRFAPGDVYRYGEWLFPAGAFHGAGGGPC